MKTGRRNQQASCRSPDAPEVRVVPRYHKYLDSQLFPFIYSNTSVPACLMTREIEGKGKH